MLIREEKRGDVTAELSGKVAAKLHREFTLVAQEVWVDSRHRVDDDLDQDEKGNGFNVICMMNECADVIQATCNLLAAYEVKDFTGFMEACRARNVERGRM